VSIRNGIPGLPDDPEYGEIYGMPDGYGYMWTVNGWRVIHEPPRDTHEIHEPR
jgi:hypothetical protein